MQYPFSCIPATLERIEATISPARLARYLPAAGGDRHFALRLYVWNMRICEATYLPIQFAEVAVRNAISIPVKKRFGPEWFQDRRFINLLSESMKIELKATIGREISKRGRGRVTQDHIVGGLSFGFWVRLIDAQYRNHLWATGVRGSFPNASVTDDRASIHVRLDQLREFRNDVAHHYAIFDKHPQREFLNTIYVTKLVCDDTRWFSEELSTLNRVINERPRF